MGRLELICLINQVERVIAPTVPRYGSATYYTLNLGEIPGCWVCGVGPASEFSAFSKPYLCIPMKSKLSGTNKIWRGSIGLCWEAKICDRCEEVGAWTHLDLAWPMNLHRANEGDNHPAWHDRVPIPEIARDPQIVEWLARRQIYFGRYPPNDLAWTRSGDMVRVLEASPREYLVEMIDRHGHNGTSNGRETREWIGPFNEEKMRLADLLPTARNPYLPQFDWESVHV